MTLDGTQVLFEGMHLLYKALIIAHLNKAILNLHQALSSQQGMIPLQAYSKVLNAVPFFVCSYAIKEEQKLVSEKEMICLEKLGIIKKGVVGCSFPILLVKENTRIYIDLGQFSVFQRTS